MWNISQFFPIFLFPKALPSQFFPIFLSPKALPSAPLQTPKQSLRNSLLGISSSSSNSASYLSPSSLFTSYSTISIVRWESFGRRKKKQMEKLENIGNGGLGGGVLFSSQYKNFFIWRNSKIVLEIGEKFWRVYINSSNLIYVVII